MYLCIGNKTLKITLVILVILAVVSTAFLIWYIFKLNAQKNQNDELKIKNDELKFEINRLKKENDVLKNEITVLLKAKDLNKIQNYILKSKK